MAFSARTRLFDALGTRCIRVSISGLLILLGCWSVRSASPALEAVDQLSSSYVVNPRSEKWVFNEVNRVRVHQGIQPLKKNEKLQRAARQHSYDMASLGYFSHEDLDGKNLKQRLSEFSVGWSKIAENIAKCLTDDPARTAVEGWLHSEGHRRNIFNPEFTETGIGAYVGPDGEVSFCQIFMRP
jgi:uncharacterized protein YkwD